MSQLVNILDLGMVDYQKAWDTQTHIHQTLIKQKRSPHVDEWTNHHLIFCEHPHVYTLGKSGRLTHLLADGETLQGIQAQFFKINRGGDITYHGPGQLVVYPILDLDRLFTDVHRYVRLLEEVVILTLADFGLPAGRIQGLTGVWLNTDRPKPSKICAIGVHLSRWVTLHGLALNVNTDLSYFDYIVPCGIQASEKFVTSMKSELGAEQSMKLVKESFLGHFFKLFGLERNTSYDRKTSIGIEN